MARQELNAKTDNPKTKNDLTKKYMLDYIKYRGTDEDKEWYIDLIEKNQKEKNNNLTGKSYVGTDLKKVREAFVKRFFPNLEKEKKSGTTYLDQVRNALK